MTTPRRTLIKDTVLPPPTSSPTISDGKNSTRPNRLGQLVKDALSLSPTAGPTSSSSLATPTTANTTTTSSSQQQQLVLLGYDENDSPIFKRPCLSNDNDEPYKDNCTASHIFGTKSSESYTYECTTEQYCNSHAPGNSHDLGWTFVGTCDIILSCPDPYDESKADKGEYVLGDQTMISGDYLDGNEIGSISCPGVSSNSQNNNGDETSVETVVLVPYVYEVETSQVSTADDFLPQLEERILLNLADSMMSCTTNTRRKLPKEVSWMKSIMQRFLSANQGVQCSVRGIESRPEDVAIAGGEI